MSRFSYALAHAYLDVDEGCKVQLVSRPLTNEELVALLLRQRVQKLSSEIKNKEMNSQKV